MYVKRSQINDFVINVQRDSLGWWCIGGELGAAHESMAESLAALWLKLHGEAA